MIDPLVRPATLADVDQLCQLETEARAALDGRRGGARWIETHPERGARWPESVESTHVAHIDEVCVGYIVGTLSGVVVRIDDVYVTPQARQLGFGDALLAATVARARERGARLVEGEALPGDRDTKNLFERARITARLITVSAPI